MISRTWFKIVLILDLKSPFQTEPKLFKEILRCHFSQNSEVHELST
jgi:hypothetical protein